MHQTIRRLLSGAVVASAALSSQAFALTTLDFEPSTLTGLYFPGETFTQLGYTFTVGPEFGTIDTALAMGQEAPSGNATQFYFSANDGKLTLTNNSVGTAFSLSGFAAAFVPLNPASTQGTVMVARGTTMSNALVTASFAFGASASSSFPFVTYSGAAFNAFTNLKQVEFFACSVAGCTQATLNNGQFAIDNILVTAVPEPTPAALLALGLLGMALRARRSAR